MTTEHENVQPTATDRGGAALSVLRDIWTAREQRGADLAELGGHGKACKNMRHLGFHGMGDDDAGADDIRAAWKAQLEREGKLDPEAESVRELMLGSQDSQ